MMRRRDTSTADREGTDAGQARRERQVEQFDWQPLPEALAAWTGNLLYWVASTGGAFYAAALAPLAIEPAQVAVLQVLAAEGPLVQARLSERTRIDRTTMVALLNALEAQGLIARQPNPRDRRAFDVHLLERGRQRLAEVEQLSREADRQFFAALSPSEQQQLHSLLRRLATTPPASASDTTTGETDEHTS
jgi:MarR family transcriptional regulator, lower aerobic nicotinate degradation pathway regulator